MENGILLHDFPSGRRLAPLAGLFLLLPQPLSLVTSIGNGASGCSTSEITKQTEWVLTSSRLPRAALLQNGAAPCDSVLLSALALLLLFALYYLTRPWRLVLL